MFLSVLAVLLPLTGPLDSAGCAHSVCVALNVLTLCVSLRYLQNPCSVFTQFQAWAGVCQSDPLRCACCLPGDVLCFFLANSRYYWARLLMALPFRHRFVLKTFKPIGSFKKTRGIRSFMLSPGLTSCLPSGTFRPSFLSRTQGMQRESREDSVVIKMRVGPT